MNNLQKDSLYISLGIDVSQRFIPGAQILITTQSPIYSTNLQNSFLKAILRYVFLKSTGF